MGVEVIMALSKNGQRIGAARHFELRDEMEYINAHQKDPKSYADACFCDYGYDIACPTHDPDCISLRKAIGEKAYSKFWEVVRFKRSIKIRLAEVTDG